MFSRPEKTHRTVYIKHISKDHSVRNFCLKTKQFDDFMTARKWAEWWEIKLFYVYLEREGN